MSKDIVTLGDTEAGKWKFYYYNSPVMQILIKQ